MTYMSKAQANKIIYSLFAAIPDIWHGYRLMSDKMLELEATAEKEHRKGRYSVKGFSVKDAARYFVIKHLFDGKDERFTLEDMLDIRHEAMLGQAYAMRYKAELAEWFAKVEASDFAKIDYSLMMC